MAVAGAVTVALSCSACAALDQALVDPGDADLVADASVRAAPPEQAGFELATRPVDFGIDFADDRSWARTSSDAGTCGWSDADTWQAGLGAGATELSADAEGRTWSGLRVVTVAEVRAPVGEEDREFDAVLMASYGGWDVDTGLVEQEGRLVVAASGLSARFSSEPEPSVPKGDEVSPLAGAVVTIGCRTQQTSLG